MTDYVLSVADFTGQNESAVKALEEEFNSKSQFRVLWRDGPDITLAARYNGGKEDILDPKAYSEFRKNYFDRQVRRIEEGSTKSVTLLTQSESKPAP